MRCAVSTPCSQAVNTKKEYQANVHMDIEDYHRLLKTAISGKFIQFPAISIDDMILSVSFFPKGHAADPSGANLMSPHKCSVGLSIVNKLDVLHRLKRGGGGTNTLDVDIKIGGGNPHKLKFDLRQFVARTIVFEELRCHPSRLSSCRAIDIAAKIKYEHAWDRHTQDRDDFRLRLYRLSILEGDVTLYLITVGQQTAATARQSALHRHEQHGQQPKVGQASGKRHVRLELAGGFDQNRQDRAHGGQQVL